MLGQLPTDSGAANHPLAIVYRAVAELVPDARNARTHSRQQVEQIAASIRNFGFTNPVLIDAAGGVIAGHGRLLAARAIGLREVPTIMLSGLSGPATRALMLADNRIALSAGWDVELLTLELGALKALDIDLGLTGFSDAEIALVLDDGTGAPGTGGGGGGGEKKDGPSTGSGRTGVDGERAGKDRARAEVGVGNAPSPIPPAPGTRPGDIWRLGPHRVGCGDVRDADFFAALTADAAVAGIWIDLAGKHPPVPLERALRLRPGPTAAEVDVAGLCWCAADPARVDAVIEEWVWATGGTPERVRREVRHERD